MRQFLVPLSIVVGILYVGRSPVPESMPAREAQPTVTTRVQANHELHRQPDSFIPNLGQWEHDSRYVASFGAMVLFLDESGWTFTLVEQPHEKQAIGMQSGSQFEHHTVRETMPMPKRGVAVRMTFKGVCTEELSPQQRQPGVHNYFTGNNRETWRSDVPLYGAVRYREIQPGVDVLARGQDGHFEYDLVLKPNAKLERVEITVAGIDSMHIDDHGSLVFETQLGPVVMPTPPSWEEGPSGEKSPIVCKYVLLGDNRFGFEVPARRPEWGLVVDPGLLWSNLIGGTSNDQAYALAIDAQGATTIAGMTAWSGNFNNFPTTLGAFDPRFNPGLGNVDAFVTKLSPSGLSLIYSTFLGGTSTDYVLALALDAQGAATVGGYTSSHDFPTTQGAFDTPHNGAVNQDDAFVTRLSPSGSSLVYSTFLGGTNDDVVRAIAVDAQGAATVAGQTASANFPTTPGAFDRSFSGSWVSNTNDSFVAQLSPSGSNLVYSTFLGGTSNDVARGIALDAQGAATIVGFTNSTDFPTTTGAFDRTFNGGIEGDAFVTRLSPSGSNLVYSTFLGSTRNDVARAVAVDAQGTATVGGYTYSSNFPTTPGAFDTTYNSLSSNSPDAFVTRLSRSGAKLIYSTFLGSRSYDFIHALALDPRGAVTVAGWTGSSHFPTTPGAFNRTENDGSTAFVSRLSPSGSSLIYSTFLGGWDREWAEAVAVDAQGAVTVAGWTTSFDFPTTPGAFAFHGGPSDAFVSRLDMLPTGVSTYGASSSGCTGPLAISVTSIPQVGNAAFSLTCTNAPPNAIGGLVIGGARFSSPPLVLGARILVSGSGPFFFVGSLRSDALGSAEYPMPIPTHATIRGLQTFTQFVWLGPTGPAPCPPLGMSASNALHITVQ